VGLGKQIDFESRKGVGERRRKHYKNYKKKKRRMRE
jgi:hypothetical protein